MLDAILSKFEKPLSLAIAIDDNKKEIHFYSINEKDKNIIKHDIELYDAGLFTNEFYEKFDEILKGYCDKNKNISSQKVALVIPNRVIMFDTISVPVINRQIMESSLSTLVNSLYKNHEQLKFNNTILFQNKQSATYNIVAIRKEILVMLKKICDSNHINVVGVTFASNAIVNGASNFNESLKTESSIVVDIKEDYTYMTYVSNGKVCGYYSLRFGSSMLYKKYLAAEDLLLENKNGKLLVLNAKEKAKARVLTSMEQIEPIIDEVDVEDENQLIEENRATYIIDKVTGRKKQGRKLPKFMLRELPNDEQGYVYENFRIYMKWAQDLITFNPELASFGNPKKVFVNIPKEFEYVFEMANNENKNNGIELEYLPLISSEDVNEEILNNLELYGGLYSKIFNKSNCF